MESPMARISGMDATPTQKVVVLALACPEGPRTVAGIAQHTGIKEWAVRDALGALRANGDVAMAEKGCWAVNPNLAEEKRETDAHNSQLRASNAHSSEKGHLMPIVEKSPQSSPIPSPVPEFIGRPGKGAETLSEPSQVGELSPGFRSPTSTKETKNHNTPLPPHGDSAAVIVSDFIEIRDRYFPRESRLVIENLQVPIAAVWIKRGATPAIAKAVIEDSMRFRAENRYETAPNTLKYFEKPIFVAVDKARKRPPIQARVKQKSDFTEREETVRAYVYGAEIERTMRGWPDFLGEPPTDAEILWARESIKGDPKFPTEAA